MPKLTAEQVMRVGETLLTAMGANAEEAHVVGEHLMLSHLAGHDSHGLIRLPQYAQLVRDKKLAVGQPVTIERETPTTALINGNWTWGALVAMKATELAIAKAKEQGMSAIAVKNCPHVGRVGVYPLLAAKAGFIAQMWCNVHGVVRMAPWGGMDARMGTNPVSIAVPTRTDPMLVDITTTVVAEGKVRLAKNSGKSIPEGWVLDKNGQPTTDPGDLYDGGSLLPFGGAVGHKGYALGLLVDLLGGTVSGAGCGVMPGVAMGNGLYLTLVDPAAFSDREEFLDRVDAYLKYIKSSRPQPGVAEILLPGDPELRAEQKRRAEGIDIDEGTWGQLGALAKELGTQLPV